jgi:hypothetical protein
MPWPDQITGLFHPGNGKDPLTMASAPDEAVGAQTSNQLSGTVAGSAVQARTIRGGVHVHAAPAAPWPWTPRQLPPRPAYFTDRPAR